MTTAAIVFFVVVCVLTLIEVGPGIAIVRRLRLASEPTLPDEELPRAVIVMALRGADADLPEGLRNFMQLDYPDYEFHIVVDSETDPAWQAVQQAIADTGATNVRVSPLADRPDGCSLHCASLLQLTAELDESFEIIALADGDVNPHASWLRELAEPLVRDQSDATFGLRWYMPRIGRMGSLLRYAQNITTIPSHLGNAPVPWGGTLAAKREQLLQAGIRDRWSRSLAVDAPIHEAWLEHGLRLQGVASLVIVNTDEASFLSVVDFLARQFTWSRLYHAPSTWSLWLIQAFIINVVLVLGIALLVMGSIRQDWTVIGFVAGALVVAFWGLMLRAIVCELGVRHVIAQHGIDSKWLSPRIVAKLSIATMSLPFVQVWVAYVAAFRRKLTWRGVTYVIRGRDDVTKLSDQSHASGSRATA